MHSVPLQTMIALIILIYVTKPKMIWAENHNQQNNNNSGANRTIHAIRTRSESYCMQFPCMQHMYLVCIAHNLQMEGERKSNRECIHVSVCVLQCAMEKPSTHKRFQQRGEAIFLMFTDNLVEPFHFNRNCLAEFSLKIYLQKSNGCFLSFPAIIAINTSYVFGVRCSFFFASPLEFIAIDLFGGLIVL